MAYDFFTQGRGPNIDVRLFPAAAGLGVEAGNRQKTIAESIVGGIQQGMDIYKGYQEIQRNQQIIEADPLEQQRKAAELERIQQQNRILETQAYISTQTEQLQLDAAEAKLKKDAEVLTAQANLSKKKTQFQNEFAAADPLNKKKMIFGGQYNDVFADDPDVLATSANSVRQFLTPEEQIGIDAASKRSYANKGLQAEQRRQQQQFEASRSEYENDPELESIKNRSGLTFDEMADKVRVEPHGKYISTPKGLELSPDYDPKASRGFYDYWLGNKILDQAVSSKATGVFNSYKSKKALYDGRDLAAKNRQIDLEEIQALERLKQERIKRAQAAPSGPVGPPQPRMEEPTGPPKANPVLAAPASVSRVPIITTEGEIRLSDNSDALDYVGRTIGLSRAENPFITDKGSEFLRVIEEPPSGWFGSRSGEQDAKLAESISDLSDYAARKQYEELPEEERANYDEAHVKAHNKAVVEARSRLGRDFMFPVVEGLPVIRSISQLRTVKTPEELYVLYNEGPFVTVLDNLAASFQDHVAKSRAAYLKNLSISAAFSKANSNGTRTPIG